MQDDARRYRPAAHVSTDGDGSVAPGPRRPLLTGAVVAAVLLAGCGGGGGIRIEGAWVRVTTPDRPAAGYLTIVNEGDQPDALIGVTSPAFAAVELHETVSVPGSPGASAAGSPPSLLPGSGMARPSPTAGGMGHGEGPASMTPAGSAGMLMGMRPVSEIPVPAHGRQTLQPGGYHLMLMEPTAPLTVGSTIQLTLRFRLAGDVTVTAEVRGT